MITLTLKRLSTVVVVAAAAVMGGAAEFGLEAGVGVAAAPTDSGMVSQIDRVDANAYAACVADHAKGCQKPPPVMPTTPPPTTPAQMTTPALSTTPTSTSTATSPAATPSPAGFPDASNTGWQHTGVTLTQETGDITVTTPGTIIDSMDIHGCVTVQADNVTIQRSRVTGNCSGGTIAISGDDARPASTVRITDTEVVGVVGPGNNPLVAYASFTCTRCDLHDFTGHGFQFGRHAAVIDSYVHGVVPYSADHSNGAAGFTSDNVTIQHSRIECTDFDHCTGSVSFLSGVGPAGNDVVSGNLLVGGGYTIYPGGGGVTFTNNTVLKGSYQYGPVYPNQPGAVCSGNTLSDGTSIDNVC